VHSYAVEVMPSAAKELEALPNIVLERVAGKIGFLGASPRPSGCKKLKGHKDQWRIRIGDWRIVYIIDDPARIVRVTRIAHRSEVYRS